jgi:hypothetical protein
MHFDLQPDNSLRWVGHPPSAPTGAFTCAVAAQVSPSKTSLSEVVSDNAHTQGRACPCVQIQGDSIPYASARSHAAASPTQRCCAVPSVGIIFSEYAFASCTHMHTTL